MTNDTCKRGENIWIKKTVEQNNLVTYWRNKLDWYANEATEEEYNDEEVRAIKSILEIMESEELDESYYNPEKGWERFKETLDVRMRIQDEMQRTKDKAAARKRFVFKTNGFRKVAMVASLVVALFVGGTAGAYAQKNGGFNKIKDNKEELQAAVNPSVNSENYSKTFENLEKFPMKYLNYIWTPTDIPASIELKSIDLLQNGAAINIRCEYRNQETKKFVSATKKTFIDKMSITNRLYDGYELYRDQQYDSIEVQYYIKVNDDYTEYMAFFLSENSMYILNSNCDFETIERIISENIIDGNL